METRPLTPLTLFHLPQHLHVPLFQRAYVWEEERQWEPLWEDVRRLAELRMTTAPTATHFLGAVVMQQRGGGPGLAAAYSLIDGQQRLTTLQLVLDATEAEMRTLRLVQQANRLHGLTHNSTDMGFDGVDQLKLVHSNDDGDAFQQVMLADPPVDYSELDDRLITQAHSYFAGEVQAWLSSGGENELSPRADALAGALMQGLEIVAITLDPEEDAQAIFETLNARGTPLTQADLVKNFIFQRLDREGGDTREFYDQRWRQFEGDFWTTEISLGRYSLARVAMFINHWLVSQTGEEVSTQATFARFKHWATYSTSRPMTDIVESLYRQALQYRSWIEQADVRDGDLDVPSMFTYRTQAAGFEAVKPIVLWLYDADNRVPIAVADSALRWVESWALRRSLLRRPGSDVSRTMAALIGELRQVDPQRVAERAQTYLASLDRQGTYWPSDFELRAELRAMPAYRAHRRGRLRMFLEAAEDDARGFTSNGAARSGSRVARDAMHIEHVLPQKWKMHWPVETLHEEVERDAHIHRLGNLTLLTAALNSSVSNGPWQGATGKRAALDRHDLLLINRRLRSSETWGEALIDERNDELANALIRTWPVPEGHDVTPQSQGAAEELPWIDFRDLVASGILPPGSELYARGDRQTKAVVTDDGKISILGETKDSPSGAGKVVLGRSVNGWKYWRLQDGRRLSELRPQYYALKGRTNGP